MATQVQRRKGTTVQHSTFTGASAELTVDTTKNTVVVHNGSTAGGFPLAKDSEVVHLTGAETVAGVKTLSSNPILSAGTANGVTYLNGSKVLTSGSALTFDGSTLKVQKDTNGAVNSVLTLRNDGTGFSGVGINFAQFTGTNGYIQNQYTGSGWATDVYGYDIVRFFNGATPTEQMRLTSTGLGIGTSSPSAKLEVVGNVNITGAGTSFGNGLNLIQSSVSANRWGFVPSGGALYLGKTTDSWGTNSVVATFDSSGNLGIGTSSPNARLAVVGGGIRVNGYSSNSAGDGVNIQLGVTGGVAYLQSLNGANTNNLSIDANQVTFRTGAYNTAATLDSSGNLGLGVTPSTGGYGVAFQFAHVGNGGALTAQALDINNFPVNLTANAVSSSASTWKYANTDGGSASRYEQVAGRHQFFTAPSGTAGNPISFTQAMTLDASGNLLVGTTSSTYSTSGRGVIEVNGSSNSLIALKRAGAGSAYLLASSGEFQINNNEATPTTFYVNGAERARIDSSGNLLVGKTTVSSTVTGVNISPTGGENYFVYGTSSGGQTVALNRTNSDGVQILFIRASAAVGTISVTASATAYNTTSDYRLKNVTGPITTSGAYIDNLNPVEGTWKVDGSTFVGLIAHEAQEVSRTPVATGIKDGEETQGMDYSSAEIIANLIAELQSVRKRIAALEAAA